MSEVEGLLRECAPQVLGALVRRYGHFSAAEDAVQEALLAAAGQWPSRGVPDNPRGWLVKVASRRLTDTLRSEEARRLREERAAALTPRDAFVTPEPGVDRAPNEDDALTLLFLCCHPALSVPAQIALTLRAVGGLTTAEIARACLVPEPTMAQRISRAKQKVRGVRFGRPDNWEERLPAVLQVLYLVFNEGYTATSGPRLRRADLAAEAIRLTRTVRRLLPEDREVAGLLALMLLTDARRAARTDARGELVPLDEQDRGLWDRAAVEEGVALVTWALSGATGSAGPYQVRAAIAAVHDEADSYDVTDWREILGLYDVLVELVPGPVERLSRVVALAMVRGPRAGLAALAALGEDAVPIGHRVEAVRGHLLERAGEVGAARVAYESAAWRTLSLPERRYLLARAARLTGEAEGERGDG
ncbi:RNA polymerase sigma factor [Streptomyces griseiscabiei]|uniref:Sigma-70 family RNA polymerase sigma factor n=2 Tax=Streptomyces TaxID=1883 RepID=A0ABU4LBB5_9ACTN|nr:sigma-70 family RNA polymerase sigma factor [Streptomyces griseiscabiei]MBZ3903714.1 sigma-70 family RNA polymerase sigma factor [Streptomyces griseiscabiei]MDX2912459.1 sigma-70 family RNA polymerase sigma factor [Streptomyces griseiscabiei]